MREYEYDDEVDSERDSGDDYNEDEVMCGGNDVYRSTTSTRTRCHPGILTSSPQQVCSQETEET